MWKVSDDKEYKFEEVFDDEDIFEETFTNSADIFEYFFEYAEDIGQIGTDICGSRIVWVCNV